MHTHPQPQLTAQPQQPSASNRCTRFLTCLRRCLLRRCLLRRHGQHTSPRAAQLPFLPFSPFAELPQVAAIR